MDGRRLNIFIKRHIKTCVDNGTMVQIKRSFKYTKKHEEEKKKMKKELQKARQEKMKERLKDKVCMKG